MRIWHISDTHGHHDMLEIPKDIDVVVFSGDESNYRDPVRNEFEFNSFIDWYSKVPVFHKIMIAGNHSSFIYHHKKEANNRMVKSGIIYLDGEYININGVKFFGDPYTPKFHDWCFMADRSKMDRRWSSVEDSVDVLITHGPPFSILDTSINRDHGYDLCGDKALLRHVRRINPFYHLFGHIHDVESIVNFGTRNIDGITFSNGSVVKDGGFGQIYHNGTILEI